MKSYFRLPTIVAAGTLIVSLCTFLSAETLGAKISKKLDLKDVPAVVSTAFQKAYPNAKFKSAEMEAKNGKTYYEIESTEGKVERNFLYTPEGVVYEIEEEIGVNDLPAAVKVSVVKEYTKSKIEKSEKITRGATVEFELLISSLGKQIELVVDGAGHIVRATNLTNDEEENDDDSNEQED